MAESYDYNCTDIRKDDDPVLTKEYGGIIYFIVAVVVSIIIAGVYECLMMLRKALCISSICPHGSEEPSRNHVEREDHCRGPPHYSDAPNSAPSEDEIDNDFIQGLRNTSFIHETETDDQLPSYEDALDMMRVVHDGPQSSEGHKHFEPQD